MSNETVVETVIQLSQQKPDDVIRVDLDLDELDLTAAESRATYAEIKVYVLEHTGLKVTSLYISQVKHTTKTSLMPAIADFKEIKPPAIVDGLIPSFCCVLLIVLGAISTHAVWTAA